MKRLLIFIGLLFPFTGMAQHVMGLVTDQNDQPLVGAAVIWQGTTMGTTTGDDGMFHLDKGDVTSSNLVISFVGYVSDTIPGVGMDIRVKLRPSGELKEAVVKRRQDGTIISDLSSIKKEVITTTELKKAACCDLAGAFSTQASVKTQMTNVLTNAKELRISGLSGVYNQVLVEGFPLIQGLTYTYGISSIPGTLVKNIFVSKGANSVLQGYEGISGQINVITLDPDCSEKYLVNGYVNSFGEYQLNAHVTTKKENWSNITAVHTTQPAQSFDRDKDGFLDLPQIQRYSIWSRWKYKQEDKFGWSTRIGARAMKETRLGGQVNYNPEIHEGGNEFYGQTVDIEQADFIAKTAYRFSDDVRIVFFNSITAHRQNSWYGQRNLVADQFYSYNNVQYELDWAEKHTLKTGASYRHFDINEDVQEVGNGSYSFIKNERIPGVFAENEANFFSNRLTLLTGVRLDHHNQFGAQFVPRALLRFKADNQTTIRLNAGRGWRTINLFSENIRMLISSRRILIDDNLNPEDAWNFGASVTRKFTKKKIAGYITADVGITDFVNQIFPLYLNDPQPSVYVYNITGKSRSNSAQLEAFVKVNSAYEFKAAYNYLDVYQMMDGEKFVQPFNNKHRLLGTFSLNPEHGKWHWDVNYHWYGEQRMPLTNDNPETFQRPEYSKPYSLLATQFTYNFKKLELYGGCENILDFRQLRPIVSWEDPFGDYFDTSSVWGPTRGREFYLGFRYFPGRE